MLRQLLHRPRQLWLRRMLFQVHLWLGILLSLYVAVIGCSGSVLVWEDELQARGYGASAVPVATPAPPAQILEQVHAAFPGETPTYFMWPQQGRPVYTVYTRAIQNGGHTLRVDAATGHMLPAGRTAVDWVHDLHVSLLMGRTGFVLNCLCGMGVLVLAMTGALLWWPGIRLWMRGLTVSLRHNWRRINFDTHNAIGIWTLAIVSMWGATAIPFLCPAETTEAVNFISPVRGMRAPTARTPSTLGPAASLQTIADTARHLSPGASLSGVMLPEARNGNVVAYMDSGAPGDYSRRDIHTFATDGTLLSTWHYGQNQTLGDWIVWLVNPLHFGTAWGTPMKVLWSLLGMSLPVLSLTGLLMYWNRYLRKRWRALRA